MGCEVRDCHLYCNTADVHFGPSFTSDEEGEAFLFWCRSTYGDPRQYPIPKIDGIIAEWHALKRPDPESMTGEQLLDQLMHRLRQEAIRFFQERYGT